MHEQDWSRWDDFSSSIVSEVVRELSTSEKELDRLYSQQTERAERGDTVLLIKVCRTLREQLEEVRIWETQPSFYLSLVCIGLADALESDDPEAGHKRAATLPSFLDKAGDNLKIAPVLFRDIALDMLVDTRVYLASLKEVLPELKHGLSALEGFGNILRNMNTREDFLLDRDLTERIVRFHINSEMDSEEAERNLVMEIDEMQEIITSSARSITAGSAAAVNSNAHWSEALKQIPVPDTGKEGLVGLYRSEVAHLTKHCLDHGLVQQNLVSDFPVRVAPMPSTLSAIRTSSSYSISSRYPPAGGVFYILHAARAEEAKQEYHREYRMLSAHETYPGHHLLDASRLSLKQYLRRSIEQPIFYEGWACFAEEVLWRTGYFSGHGDRLLLAKRRLWRAIRGRIDLGLHTGSIDIPAAAHLLTKTGFSKKYALHSVRKYPLNTGYQISYTLGLRRFLDLFDRYGSGNIQNFMKTVLGQGEIPFSYLEEVLRQPDQ
jgi:hypothetical protein